MNGWNKFYQIQILLYGSHAICPSFQLLIYQWCLVNERLSRPFGIVRGTDPEYTCSSCYCSLSNKLIQHFGFRYRFWPKYKVTSTWIGRFDMLCAHAQSCIVSIVGLWSFSCMTLWIGFDPTQCACTHDMSIRLTLSPSTILYCVNTFI